MSMFGTASASFTVHGSVYVAPAAKKESAVFEDVQPWDVFEVPGWEPGLLSDLKAFGKVRRLGPKRCRIDPLHGVIQVMRPPASGTVRMEWLRHSRLMTLGNAEISMTTKTTYGG